MNTHTTNERAPISGARCDFRLDVERWRDFTYSDTETERRYASTLSEAQAIAARLSERRKVIAVHLYAGSDATGWNYLNSWDGIDS